MKHFFGHKIINFTKNNEMYNSIKNENIHQNEIEYKNKKTN